MICLIKTSLDGVLRSLGQRGEFGIINIHPLGVSIEQVNVCHNANSHGLIHALTTEAGDTTGVVFRQAGDIGGHFLHEGPLPYRILHAGGHGVLNLVVHEVLDRRHAESEVWIVGDPCVVLDAKIVSELLRSHDTVSRGCTKGFPGVLLGLDLTRLDQLSESLPALLRLELTFSHGLGSVGRDLISGKGRQGLTELREGSPQFRRTATNLNLLRDARLERDNRG